jgi:hypothetical protein
MNISAVSARSLTSPQATPNNTKVKIHATPSPGLLSLVAKLSISQDPREIVSLLHKATHLNQAADLPLLQTISDATSRAMNWKVRRKLTPQEYAFAERMETYLRIISMEENLSEASAERIVSSFGSKINKDLVSKWKASNLNLKAFLYHPHLASFVIDSFLPSSARYYGHELRFNKSTNSLECMIEGRYQDLSPLANALVVHQKKLFANCKYTEICSRKEPSNTWFYLPTSGLSKWERANWKKLQPCGMLTPEQVACAQEGAKLTAVGAENGKYVIEIVTSWRDSKGNFLTSGVHHTFVSPRHPWIRIIKPDGSFYSVGFHLGGSIDAVGEVTKGVFLTPDTWETLPHSARPITGIKITESQCNDIIREIERYQADETNFQFFDQNCTRFLQFIINLIPLKETDKPVFSASIGEMLFRLQPKFVQKIGLLLNKRMVHLKAFASDFVPPIMYQLATLVSSIFQLILERILLAISGRGLFVYSQRGTFTFEKENPHKGIPWYKVLVHANLALEHRLVQAFAPIKVIEWQMKQSATRVVSGASGFKAQYDRPTKVPIASLQQKVLA